MARFRFSLQNVLDIKLKMETQAKQEFSAAVAVLDTQQKMLDNLYLKKENLEEEASKLLLGNLNFHDIDDNALARTQTDQQIAAQKINVKRAEDALERARQKMANAVMERKTYEKLRERAFEEFLKDENKAESKMVDELTSYTYGQKTKE